ncbi:MAG: DUF4349 domain-containing protein, partial [Anaerolineales bacterium]
MFKNKFLLIGGLLSAAVLLVFIMELFIGLFALFGSNANDTFESANYALEDPSAGMSPPLMSATDTARALPTPAPTQMAIAATQGAPRDGIVNTANTAQTAPEPVQQPERIIIQNADLTIQAQNPVATLDDLAALADDYGGWVVASTVRRVIDRNGAENQQGEITLRIPAARLTDALARIRAEAVQVVSQSVTGDDVTAQFVDQQSRLRNLQAAEAEVSRFMEDAQDVNEVLSVYNRLVSLREEIERIQGQLNYWQEAAAYSRLDVRVVPVPPDDEEAV